MPQYICPRVAEVKQVAASFFRARLRWFPALILPTLLVPVVLFAGRTPQQAPPSKAAPATAPQMEATLAPTATELDLREGLVVGLLGSYGRSAVPSDFLAWQLASGTFREPREGDVLGPDGQNRTQTWTRAAADKEGLIRNRALNGGYLFVVVNSARARTMILDASGYYVVYVNGEPRGGEKYGTKLVRHPVRLRAGRNTFLFRGERGQIRARLFDPPAPVFLTDVDATLPDLVAGLPSPLWAGVRLVNATESTIDSIDVSYAAGDQSGTAALSTPVSPLTTRKLAVPLALRPPASPGDVKVTIKARAHAGARLIDVPALDVTLKSVARTAHFVRTFVSEIDGSVQYYAVAPYVGATPAPGSPKPALVVSLHGAGVEATNQAHAYKPKDWAYIVAPTNRRPYGFDWEDWGRLDALEVLADAGRLFDTDPAHMYLTGHSMGGHGTWQVGVTVPDPWAAIAPSAGWHSFSSYGGGSTYSNPTAIEKMLVRANNPGETIGLSRNFLHYGIYILHGEKDTNVPVAQARFMRELLAKFHADFAYYERPGADHWWGDECVDWPPLFDFLQRHTRPTDAETTHVELVTANPGISATSHWVTVLAQEHPLEYSHVTIDRDPKTGAFKGTTENVLRLSLAPIATAASVPVELDGTKIDAHPSADGRLYLARGASGWQEHPSAAAAPGAPQAGAPPDATLKNPLRSGGFKDAFRHRVVLVYGTFGSPDENARAYQKARFDAESFWYRGNGSIEVVPDKAFDAAKNRDRNVVLYGNADTNAAWGTVLGSSPIELRNGRARIGSRTLTGADLAAYFVRPRADSPTATVGAVAWTGTPGWFAAGPIQYFVSGAGFPDLMVFSADTLRSGTAGVKVIGWFGDDWSVERGDITWKE
jgi:dienelactone hydrolase